MRYKVLIPFHWHKRGQVLDASEIRQLDVRYYIKKGLLEVYEEERAVAPEPVVETAVKKPKRTRKAK